MTVTPDIEACYNRARVKNCLNCGKLASYLRLMHMVSTITCRPDGVALSADHPRREGAVVDACWSPRNPKSAI